MARNPFGADDAEGKQPAEQINPSGPTTGTEGWGHGSDEGEVPGANPVSGAPDNRTEGSHT
ncbi:MAG: hypothetical protein JO041_16370 [Acidobacteria bacterium]|nr:hypothetical protein [Acidobacteriota bacterium]